MTKKQAIKMFGSAEALAKALGVSLDAIRMMPDQLSQRASDRVNGAALRVGIIKRALRPRTPQREIEHGERTEG